MDKIGKSLWEAKRAQNRKVREEIIAGVYQRKAAQNNFHSSDTVRAIYKAATLRNGALMKFWAEYFQDSWRRESYWWPWHMAKRARREVEGIINLERATIDREIQADLERRSFKGYDAVIKQGQDELNSSCVVLTQKYQSFVETLKEERWREIKGFWLQLAIPLIVAGFSIWLTTRANEAEIDRYKEMVENVVRWSHETPEQLDQKIRYEQMLLDRRIKNIRDETPRREEAIKTKFSASGLVRSGMFANELKKLKIDEEKLITEAREDAKFKINFLQEEKEKLFGK
ncbi:MAG: hypothetical protein IPP68_03920 [Elusimicrobia bacterium]|nr:hypothetical protein [Elusimicrobiota bacterium]